MRRSKVILFTALSLSASLATAETLTTVFTDRSKIETADAVVNTELGYLHRPLEIQNWDSGSGALSTSFSIGDGSNGSFEPSTYERFDSGLPGDMVIEVDTDVYPELQFSKFHLAPGWSLRPFGTNPLIIRSLSTLTIDSGASVDCDGENGAGLSLKTVSAPGGLGRCGGSAGGQGGSTSQPATSGDVPAGLASLAGGAGVANSDGGGGGAGLSLTFDLPTAGLSASGTAAGSAGVQIANDDFSIVGGGAGGGGGAALLSGAGESGGGGGGSGGGSIYLYSAGDMKIDGVVSSKGGNGGGSTNASRGGAGGGGSGGSLLLFSYGTLQAAGAVSADRGFGGTTAFAPQSRGGDGSSGRVWAADRNGMTAINPIVNLIDLGKVAERPGTFTATSQLFDLGSTRPTLKSILSDDDGSVVLEAATSAVPFTIADANWKPASSLLELSGQRYLRFRVSLTGDTRVRSVQIEYVSSAQNKFEFGSCARTDTPSSKGSILVCLILPLIFAMALRRRHQN